MPEGYLLLQQLAWSRLLQAAPRDDEYHDGGDNGEGSEEAQTEATGRYVLVSFSVKPVSVSHRHLLSAVYISQFVNQLVVIWCCQG